MRRENLGSNETVTLEGEGELSAALYAYSALGESSARLCSADLKDRAKVLGLVVSRVGVSHGASNEDLTLKLEGDDFALLSGAAQYLLTSRRLRRLREGASDELLEAARQFAECKWTSIHRT